MTIEQLVDWLADQWCDHFGQDASDHVPTLSPSAIASITAEQPLWLNGYCRLRPIHGRDLALAISRRRLAELMINREDWSAQ